MTDEPEPPQREYRKFGPVLGSKWPAKRRAAAAKTALRRAAAIKKKQAKIEAIALLLPPGEKKKVKPHRVRIPELPTTASPVELTDRRKNGQQVKMMASTKVTLRAMADMLHISIPQLKKEYAKELAGGQEFVYAAVSLRLVNAAMGGEFRSMYSWLRQFGGWTEVARREITGKDGGPISFRNLDDSSLAAVLNALQTSGSAGRSASRNSTPLGIDIDGATDLDALSGPADEGAEE